MAALTYKEIVVAGVNPALTAADVAGDTVAGHSRGFLHVHNGSGASINVTVAVPGNTELGQAQPDVVVAVPAGEDRMIALTHPKLVDPTDNAVHISYSAVTSVTRAAIHI